MPSNTYEDPDKMLLLYSGLEGAFIGSVEGGLGHPPVACYSKRLTLELLQSNFRLTEPRAREQYEYEYLRNDFGNATPVFLDDETYPTVS